MKLRSLSFKKLKNFKSEYILKKLPKLESKFDLNLFNTFRSYFNYDLYPIVYKNNDVEGILLN